MYVTPKFTTMVFFDRSVIKTNWKKINQTPLTKAGLLVRRIARGSIRRGKKGGKPGRPGQPPKSRQAGSTPPFKMIYSVPSWFNTSVIVGMIGFGGSNPVPGLQEHGGTAMRWVSDKLDGGRDKRGRFTKHKRTRSRRNINYPERPFMVPALGKAVPRLPLLWSSSVG